MELDKFGKQLSDMGRANTVADLAGRLSARQLEGLARYLSVRFKIN
jgi:hypothetical protein